MVENKPPTNVNCIRLVVVVVVVTFRGITTASHMSFRDNFTFYNVVCVCVSLFPLCWFFILFKIPTKKRYTEESLIVEVCGCISILMTIFRSDRETKVRNLED